MMNVALLFGNAVLLQTTFPKSKNTSVACTNVTLSGNRYEFRSLDLLRN